MSVANPASGPQPIQPSTTSANAPTRAQIAAKIDLLISVTLHNWPNLTIAIQHDPDSASAKDKRDFLAGAISDLLSTNQVTEAEDLEDVLVQFLYDEFDIAVDDKDYSPWEASLRIMTGREKILQGDFSQVDQWYEEWAEKHRTGSGRIVVQRVDDDEAQDTDWDEEDGEDENEDEGEDVEMDDAPQLVEKPKREKVEPEVDEDGFTKVVGRRKK
jgi:pre-rRNA-processing protein TSR2